MKGMAKKKYEVCSPGECTIEPRHVFYAATDAAAKQMAHRIIQKKSPMLVYGNTIDLWMARGHLSSETGKRWVLYTSNRDITRWEIDTGECQKIKDAGERGTASG
ncbi:MAG: hypothetical protein DDT20_00874 [Firmicutes bacterium]|nr:hypothetical protein [Bacillota bacterium]MBT9176554.1 hypothetical protein [Bacillota bacterium]